MIKQLLMELRIESKFNVIRRMVYFSYRIRVPFPIAYIDVKVFVSFRYIMCALPLSQFSFSRDDAV